MRENEKPDPIPGMRLLLLHLAPGVVATLVYVLLAGPLVSAGFPPITALFVAIAGVIIPVELGVIVRASRKDAPEAGWLGSVSYRRPLRVRDWLVLAPALLIVAILGFGLFSFLE